MDDLDGADQQFRDAWMLDARSHEAVFGLASIHAAKGIRPEAAWLQRVAIRLLWRNIGRHISRRALTRLPEQAPFSRPFPVPGRHENIFPR